MHKGFLLIGAISGALAVVLGAFGSHSLRNKVNNNDLQIFETAVRYQFFHVFALIAVGILFKFMPGGALIWSGRLFLVGSIIFSGSLYALIATRAAGSLHYNWLGAITPVGGTFLIAGWVCLALACANYK